MSAVLAWLYPLLLIAAVLIVLTVPYIAVCGFALLDWWKERGQATHRRKRARYWTGGGVHQQDLDWLGRNVRRRIERRRAR